MPFVLPVQHEGLPPPRCPSCKQQIDTIHARVLHDQETQPSPIRKTVHIFKMLHTCPLCHCVLGMTDY